MERVNETDVNKGIVIDGSVLTNYYFFHFAFGEGIMAGIYDFPKSEYKDVQTSDYSQIVTEATVN